ncbi:MAG: hypothetical protein ACLFVJ_05210 [Persicimonas sp.]
MENLSQELSQVAPVADDPMCQRLLPWVTLPTGTTSAGYPYLDRRGFEGFRDHVPHLFGMGERVIEAQQKLVEAVDLVDASNDARENLRRACRVVRQMARTAAITAPSDLWLMRHILGTHAELGLSERLLAGESIHPEFCEVEADGERVLLDAEQLGIDLHFLLARGIVEQYDESFRIAGHERAHALLEQLGPVPAHEPVPATLLWKKLFDGDEALDDAEADVLVRLGADAPPARRDIEQNHWLPTVDEVQIAYRLLPVVLGLRAAELTGELQEGACVGPGQLSAGRPECGEAALQILEAARWICPDGDASGDEVRRVSALGARGFSRGPGPFGIIQTYHPYMANARQILLKGQGQVWVRRGENIGASQDANRKTFERANDALDRFCEDTGFSYSVFIEHAIGRGEATRQRFERSGEDHIRYFGADLEDPAIDAAVEEQRKGRLPSNMQFVRRADIGKPDKLVDALREQDAEPFGAVMLVGNGFHEVRNQSDGSMIEVFKGYHRAGIVLLFTEENALSIDDLRATAFNTYHAGFKYVHEKSGQCLRPASPRPRPRLGPPLRAAWSECATKAGYVRLEAYSARTRTIYPYPRRDGHNPSISVNHFFVPRPIADKLGLVD